MSEAQGSAPQGGAPLGNAQGSAHGSATSSNKIVDANKPTIKNEMNRVEDRLNPKPEQKQPGETQAQYEKRKFKVKIEGKEAEVDEDELIRSYQVRKVSDKKAREGEMSKKQAEQFISMLKDPQKFWELAKDPRIGHDPRKMAEEYLAMQLQDELMDPRDRELRDARAQIKQHEDLKKKEAEEIENRKAEALKKQWTDSYTTDIVKALETSGLPRKPETVKRIANKMALSIKIEQPITAAEAVILVKEDLIEESKSIYSDTPAETLASLLGEEKLKQIREWDISRLKNPRPPAPEVKGAKEIENKKGQFADPSARRKFIRGF